MSERLERELGALFAADAARAPRPDRLNVPLVEAVAAADRRHRRWVLAALAAGVAAVLLFGVPMFGGSPQPDRAGGPDPSVAALRGAVPSGSSPSGSTGGPAMRAVAATRPQPFLCELPRALARTVDGHPANGSSQVLATVGVGRMVTVEISIQVPRGVGVIHARTTVAPPDIGPWPLPDSLLAGQAPLPRHSGSTLLRFSASDPGDYPVLLDALVHASSDCPSLNTAASAPGAPSGSPVPATWAASVAIGQQLGVISVR